MDIKLVPSLELVYEKLKKAARNELVYLTGPPSTGKTTLVRKLFKDYKREYIHAYVDCYDSSTQSKLLSSICQALYSALEIRTGRSRACNTGSRFPEPGEQISMSDFPRILCDIRRIADEKGYKRMFIVLDQVELFERTTMMDTFVALCRFNALSLRMIVISCEDPADLVQYVAQKSPAIAMSVQDRYQVVACNAWSKEDIIEWILESPPKCDEHIYSKFVRNIVVLVYNLESKDPRQIRMYCQEHFEDFIHYYRPKKRDIVRKQLKQDLDSTELIDQQLDEYELSANLDTSLVASFLQEFKVRISKDKDNSRWTHRDTEVKMAPNSAVLIVAAYIAAYTKPSEDKNNFIRLQRSRRASNKNKHMPDYQNKPFSIERLIHIYIRLMRRAIGNQRLNIIYNNDHVLSDIERFENLNILQHVSGSDLCSDARYKLSHCIKRAYVQRLAENNSLDLEWYGLSKSTS